MRDAQYELRAAAKNLRTATQLHVGPNIVKAYAKCLEALNETRAFFEMVEEQESEDEE